MNFQSHTLTLVILLLSVSCFVADPVSLGASLKVDYVLSDTNNDGKPDKIRVTLITTKKAWASIGLGGEKMATVADYVICSITGSTFNCQDFGVQQGDTALSVDPVQNVQVVAAECKRTDTETIFVFDRNLETGDASDYKIPVGTSFPIIWAQGTTDDTTTPHELQGTVPIILKQTPTVKTSNSKLLLLLPFLILLISIL